MNKEISEKILAAANSEWILPVYEARGKNFERINVYIREGLLWPESTRFPKYTKNGQFEWCGAFASFCYAAAGLKPSIRKENLASTYRLDQWSKGNARRLKPEEVLPGDIIVVRTSSPSPKRWGDHIAIAREITKEAIHTVEGNGRGQGPDGSTYFGVVHRTWKIGKPEPGTVLYGVRPLPEDYLL